MKKLISKFSEKLLSKQQLKTVKGGTPYCFCHGSPVDCGPNDTPGGLAERCHPDWQCGGCPF